MSARGPRDPDLDPDPDPDRDPDPDPDREQRSPRRPPDLAGNELPAEREQRSAGCRGNAEGNELPAPAIIARIATSQNGSITNAQMARAGLGHSAIGRRSGGGALHRVHRGVYLVGHEAHARFARERAALLACGDDAVISHSSAAVVWQLAPGAATPDVHVTVIGGKRRCRRGLQAHRTKQLDPRDRRWIDGLPVTSPARTLLDLAATRHPGLERAFANAHAQGLVKSYDLVAAIERAGPRAGVRALTALINDNASGYTRSQAERLLRRLIRDANLPEPRFNVPFRRYELDAVWPDQRLVLEVDGYSYHGHRAQFESDRRKDQALTAAGYTVIRVTWRQLTNEPLVVVAVIATALGRGRVPG